MTLRAILLSLFLLPLGTGCGGAQNPKFQMVGDTAAPAVKEAGGGEKAAGDPAGDPVAMKAAAAPADRKIVYTATLEIIVKDLDEVLPQVEKLVGASKGYTSRSEVKSDTGSRRSAIFTIRVPVESFATVRDGLLPLGVPQRNALDSQDVTEEYVDVQARIKNLKEQEDKLNELLKEKRKEEKLEDIIRVSDRIAEVRRDVERVQGRLNYLANMTTLATIHLTLREIKDYKPPTTPTFGNRATSTLEKSWEAVVDFVQEFALAAVALVPWLPLIAPAVAALVWAVRRYRRLAREERAARPRPDHRQRTGPDDVALTE